MAAIKYTDPDTNRPVIVTGRHHSGDAVLVRLNGGGLLRVPLLGFWHIEGDRSGGRLVRVVASEVTNESGNDYSVWRDVPPGSSVLGWVAPGMKGWEDCGLYGMCDKAGWPIVVK